MAVSNKLVVVVYDQDLPQFQVFCHCLNKYWQDTRNLTVVVGKPDVTQTYQFIMILDFVLTVMLVKEKLQKC